MIDAIAAKKALSQHKKNYMQDNEVANAEFDLDSRIRYCISLNQNSLDIYTYSEAYEYAIQALAEKNGYIITKAEKPVYDNNTTNQLYTISWSAHTFHKGSKEPKFLVLAGKSFTIEEVKDNPYAIKNLVVKDELGNAYSIEEAYKYYIMNQKAVPTAIRKAYMTYIISKRAEEQEQLNKNNIENDSDIESDNDNTENTEE